jgi:hypothetical protein
MQKQYAIWKGLNTDKLFYRCSIGDFRGTIFICSPKTPVFIGADERT